MPACAAQPVRHGRPSRADDAQRRRCRADAERAGAARRARLVRPALRRPRLPRSASRTACAACRIAFSPTLGYVAVEPEVAGLVAAAAAVFEELGARVEEVDPGFGDPGAVFKCHWYVGAANLLRGFSARAARADGPGAGRRSPPRARRVPLMDYLAAVGRRGALGARMRRFHESYDLLLTPTAAARRVRRRAGASRPAPRGPLDRLGAVQPPVQPEPAAGGLGALRPDRGRPAGRPADRRPDARATRWCCGRRAPSRAARPWPCPRRRAAGPPSARRTGSARRRGRLGPTRRLSRRRSPRACRGAADGGRCDRSPGARRSAR